MTTEVHADLAPLAGDNSLTDLAARIRAEHEAVSEGLKESVRHAIAAGELLIEAKGQLGHGQWLPWLRDRCTISEGTAQLYMRVAKNRAEIEAQIRNGVAALSLNEVAAVLMLSSDVRKLLNFAKTAEGLSGEEPVDSCIANDAGVIHSAGYNPFAGRTEAEKLEWMAFTIFLSCDLEAARGGYAPQDAWSHVEYLLQRPFQNVDEWLGPEGDGWRRICLGDRHPSEEFKTAWAAFRDAHRGLTLAEVTTEAVWGTRPRRGDPWLCFTAGPRTMRLKHDPETSGYARGILGRGHEDHGMVGGPARRNKVRRRGHSANGAASRLTADGHEFRRMASGAAVLIPPQSQSP
jgi:hypothetical protein